MLSPSFIKWCIASISISELQSICAHPLRSQGAPFPRGRYSSFCGTLKLQASPASSCQCILSKLWIASATGFDQLCCYSAIFLQYIQLTKMKISRRKPTWKKQLGKKEKHHRPEEGEKPGVRQSTGDTRNHSGTNSIGS